MGVTGPSNFDAEQNAVDHRGYTAVQLARGMNAQRAFQTARVLDDRIRKMAEVAAGPGALHAEERFALPKPDRKVAATTAAGTAGHSAALTELEPFLDPMFLGGLSDMAARSTPKWRLAREAELEAADPSAGELAGEAAIRVSASLPVSASISVSVGDGTEADAPHSSATASTPAEVAADASPSSARTTDAPANVAADLSLSSAPATAPSDGAPDAVTAEISPANISANTASKMVAGAITESDGRSRLNDRLAKRKERRAKAVDTG